MSATNRSGHLGLCIALVMLCTTIEPAAADHGGSTHEDFSLTLPSTSGDGSYTVTWFAGSFDVDLEESYEGGPYTGVYFGRDTTSFSGKQSGTYSYRIYFEYCYYECTEAYSLPELIVVAGAQTPEDIFASLESLVQTEFEELMVSQGATNQQRAAAESDILQFANEQIQRPTNRATEEELVLIYKIRLLQKYDSEIQQNGLPSEIGDLLEEYNLASEFNNRGVSGGGT